MATSHYLILCIFILSKQSGEGYERSSFGLNFGNLFQFNTLEKVAGIVNDAFEDDQSGFYVLREGADLIITDLLQFPNTVSSVCAKDVKYFLSELTAVKNGRSLDDDWPIQMLDSMGKPPSGILKGNLFWLGKYQQCLDVVAKNQMPNVSKEEFIGEYCLVNFQTKQTTTINKNQGIPIILKIGLCFPSTCSFEDKLNLMTFKTSSANQSVTMEREHCQTKEKSPMDTTAIICVIVISLFGVFVLLGTCAEVAQNRGRDAANQNGSKHGLFVITSFSAIKSLKSIFNLEEKVDDLSAIHGIRVLSMFLVVIAHVESIAMISYPWKNQLDALNMFNNFLIQPILFNATYAVTTFYTISGLLVSYLYMKQIDKKDGKYDLIRHYVHRYFRLTSPLIIVILFMAGPLYYMNDSPIWPALKNDVDACRTTWWENLLYVTNFMPGSLTCVRSTWYLSPEIQLYYMAPIVLYPLFRMPLVGCFLLSISFLGSVIYAMIVIGVNQYETCFGMNTSSGMFESYMSATYFQTNHHISSYAIGICFGYLLHVCRKNKIVLTKKITIPCWIFALSIVAAIMYGTYPYFKGTATMSSLTNILYGALGRPAWALAVSWIICACAQGHGGLINWVLSLAFFKPMSRLTYSAYLTHDLVLSYYFAGQQDGLYFSTYNMMMIAISNIVVTMATALVLTVLIEMPCIEILNQLGKKQSKQIN